MTIARQSTGHRTGAPTGCRTPRPDRCSGSGGGPLGRIAGLLVAGALLALPACTAYEEVFGEEPVPGIVTTGTGPQQNAVVPNLASVPGRPSPSSNAQREALQEALREDRSRAVYSGEPPSSSPPSSSAGVSDDVERPLLPPPSQSGRGDVAEQPSPMPPPPAPPSSAPSSSAPQPAPASTAAASPAPAPSAAVPPPASSARAPAVGPGQLSGYNLPRRPSHSELLGVVFFGYGSASLDQRDAQVLRQIVQLQQQRGGQLRVVGHASLRTGVKDPLQHNLANFNTSLERAQAVAERLQALGAPPVVVEAMGAAQPIYYEFMPTGEAGNRRAEIFLDF